MRMGLIMLIKEQISSDVKAAMKAREKLKLETLRMALAAIKNKEIEKKTDIQVKLRVEY